MKKLSNKKIEDVIYEHSQGISNAKIAAKTKISSSSVRKILKEKNLNANNVKVGRPLILSIRQEKRL